MANKKAKVWLFSVLLIAAFVLTGSAVTAVNAATDSYYICYESSGYRVSATNALKAEGGQYTVSPYLARGDKFMISDGKGGMWGNAKGEPVTVTETGKIRYTVTFDPAKTFEDGAHIAVDFYAPAAYTLQIGASEQSMTYRRANAAYEEYYLTAEVPAGTTVTVKGKAGVYGEKGLNTAGVTVPMTGSYRFSFTADGDHLYTDDCYIVYEETPELYLLCTDNQFSENERYRLERDEQTAAYAQYRYRVSVPQNDYALTYRIYDKKTDKTYLPSESGTITVKDKGDYDVLYSPDHIYSASEGEVYRTGVQRVAAYYDGWYVLGDFNGYTYVQSDDFDASYRLVKDETQTSYNEYRLTLYITDEMLSRYDGRVEFYISDGASIYRKPSGNNIGIDAAGEYELTFSPTHNYGREYRYKYVRVGDSAVTETVRISTADEFLAFTAACTSPEYSLNKTFVLTSDLNLSGKAIVPARIFAGTFDGMYRQISGIALSGDDGISLFHRVTADGSIQRAAFQIHLDGGDNTALVGENAGLLQELEVTGTVEGKGYVSALAASVTGSGSVKDCTAHATVNGVMNVGGIAGFSAGKLSGCVNEGTINGKTFAASDAVVMLNAGGIAGYSTGRIFDCTNRGSVGRDQGRYMGGITGLSSGGIYQCYNYGAVGAERYAGGIVGYYGRFDNGNNNPLLEYLKGTEYEQWLDRYFGSDDGNFEEAADSGVHEVYYAFNLAEVHAENYAGGIAGHAGAASLKIVGCLSGAAVRAHTAYAGGIVGDAGECTVSECMSYGDVIAQKGSYAGGIAGSVTGTLEYCQSSAYVQAEGYAGGIAGSGKVVRNCVSNTFVTMGAGTHFGMIAGQATDCAYNYFVRSGVGGIDGVNYGAESDYAACALFGDELMSEGMLSPALYGLDAAHWLAGEYEPRYPVPRAFTDMVIPDGYPDAAAYARRFDSDTRRGALSEAGGKALVTVTFYSYNFDADKYERMTSFRIRKGDGVDAPQPPAQKGYFVFWDIADFSAFNEDTSVHMRYDKALTTVASDDTTRPAVMAEGVFYSDTKLALDYNGEYISPVFTRGGKRVLCGDVTIRYYLQTPDRYRIKLIQGGTIVNATVKYDGEYAVFVLPEGFAFAAVALSGNSNVLWIVLAGVGGAAVVSIAFAVPLLIVRRKKKRAGNTYRLNNDGTQVPQPSDECAQEDDLPRKENEE